MVGLAYEAVALGVSAGGLEALSLLLAALPANLPMAVIVVQHRPSDSGSFLVEYFAERCSMRVIEAEEKELARSGNIYFAPAAYHLLVERDKTFSFSVDEKVNFSRPSIDVLFETAALAYGVGLIGVVLTGANGDGAAGLQTIKRCGGLAVVQDPDEAKSPFMPRAAIDAGPVDYVLELAKIVNLIKEPPCQNNTPRY